VTKNQPCSADRRERLSNSTSHQMAAWSTHPLSRVWRSLTCGTSWPRLQVFRAMLPWVHRILPIIRRWAWDFCFLTFETAV
jgi:hypothetical protein